MMIWQQLIRLYNHIRSCKTSQLITAHYRGTQPIRAPLYGKMHLIKARRECKPMRANMKKQKILCYSGY